MLGGALAGVLAGCAANYAGPDAGIGLGPSSLDAAGESRHASESVDASASARRERAASAARDVQAAVSQIVASYGEGASVTFMPVGAPEGLVSINGGVQHSSASMIKLLVLAALLDAAQQGTVDLDADVEVAPEDIVAGTGTVQEDGPGTYALRELARRMIADSDNTATNVIVDLIGMDAVNDEAGKLGLSGTVMARKMMDTAAADQGMQNRMSSDDAAKILNMIATGTLVNQQMSDLALGFLLQQSLGAGLAEGVPEGVDVAHKTGELVQVEHDGGIVLAAYPYVLVVMTEGMDNGDGVSLIAQVSAAVYAATNGGADAPGQTDAAAAALAAAGASEGPTGTYSWGDYDEPDVAFVGYDGSDYASDDWGEDYGYDDGGYDDGGYDDGTDAPAVDVPAADTPAVDVPATDGGATGGATDAGGTDAGTGDTGTGTDGGTTAPTTPDAGGTDAAAGGGAGGADAGVALPDNDVAA